jgi:hypothetical protein
VNEQAGIAIADALVDALRPLVAKLVETELEQRLAALERADWLTLDEAASYLRTTADALRHRAQRGCLPGAVKDESRWLVDRRRLDQAMADATLRLVTTHKGRAPLVRPRPRHRRR